MITIEIEGNPVPYAAPRVTKFGTFDRKKQDKDQTKWQIRSQYRSPPIAGAVCVDYVFFMPIPKNTSSVKRRQMLNGVIKHDKKPDTSNLVKLYEDCIKNIAIQDDSNVYSFSAKKVYAEKPGVLIRIKSAEETNFIAYENFSRTD